MKIVIDIEEGRYNWIMSHASNDAGDYANSEDLFFRKAVESGTVLPKGHGKLVDGDLLDSKMYHAAFETDTNFQKWDSGCWIRYKLYENIRDEIPVVLAADKEH
jgi:hypothetical protein